MCSRGSTDGCAPTPPLENKIAMLLVLSLFILTCAQY